ncbi:ABC transporter permease subunit [uncultured Flavonifractor sp.]|uniref:ABC transporter permease subunit n=1 Tax=uncultured Flavonifractor sp. TaxID=1193534 RepID=UPI00263A1A80|nr:ABC transporter permease [uncultured Flavonifractor sp.]
MTAIYRRELGSYFHGMTAYVFIAFLLVFSGIYTMIYNLNAGYPNFEYVLQAMSIIFLIAIPVLTMRVVAEERRQKTDQLLYALPLGMTRVVLGKYLAMLTVVAIPCAIMGLYPLLLSAFGSVFLPTAYGTLVGFFLLSATLAAIGLFISSLTENQAVAAGLCFGVMLLIFFMADLSDLVPDSTGASLAALLVTVLAAAGLVRIFTRSTPAALVVAIAGEAGLFVAYLTASDAFAGLFGKLADGLSVFERFYVFANGVFDLTAVLYFLSVIAVALFLAVQSMEKRRWS